jgi:hypothetical protein
MQQIAERLARHVRALVAAWLVLFVAIAVTAPRYNDAQRAGDPSTFRAVVDDGTPWRFVVAAVLDQGFAVAYGLLGLAFGWREQSGERTGRRRVRRVAGSAVVLGALCDLVENVVVIANVARRDELTAGWVDVMRTLGDLKWLLGLGGAAVLVALLVADALGRRRGAAGSDLR